MSETVKNVWPKRILWAVLGVIFVLMVTVIGLILWVQSDGGRDFVETRLERMEFVGQSVDIDGLNGSVLGEFEIERMTLTGRDGPWLVAQDVSVDWSPRALLSKSLSVDRVRIGDLDVLQKPILVPGDDDGGDDPAVTVFNIQGIDLRDVSLAEPVVGQAINLSASGQFLQGPEGGAAVISARSDQDDTVETNLSWSPLLVLSGEADIVGAPGGLIGRLLRLDPTQRMTAKVTTDNSQTVVQATIDGADFVGLTIERGQSTASVIGSIEPSRLPVLDPITPYLGGTTQFDAVLPLDQGASARLTLRSARVTLDATGERQGEALLLDRIMINATDPLQPLALDGIKIDRMIAEGRGVIGDAYEFEGAIEGTGLHYQDYQLDRLSGPAVLTFSDGVIGFDTDLRGTSSTLASANGARLEANGQITLSTESIAFSQADINLPGLSLRGQGQIGYGARRTADFAGRYDVDTAIFREGPSAKLTGRLKISQTDKGPVAELSGQARKIANIPDAVAPLITRENGTGLDYTAWVRFEQGRVAVPRFTAKNDGLSVTGAGRWQNGQLSSDIQYDVESYDFGAVAAQSASGTAVLSGPPRALGFETELTAQTLNAGALKISDAAMSATGTYTDGTISLSSVLSGETPQGRVDTQADIALVDGNWAVTGLNGVFGDIDGKRRSIRSGSDLTTLRADLTLSGTTDIIAAEMIEAKILLGDSQVDIDATLNGVTYAPLEQATVRLLAKGPRDAVAYQIDADGITIIQDLERPLNFSATGLGDLRENSISTRADFNMSISDLTLSGLASAQRREAGWAAEVDATGLGGGLTLGIDPSEGGALSFEFDRLSVPQLARLVARPATEGSVSGDGRFAIMGDHVEGAAKIMLNDLRSPISDSDPITLAIDLILADEQLALTLGATEGGLSGQARIAGAVETGPRAPFLTYPPAIPLVGSANLNGEIGPIIELFLPPRTDVAGQIETDLQFTVPATPTGLTGRIVLSGGVFEQGAIGLELIDIDMLAELTGETISVPRLSARGRDGGTLQGSGRMGLGEGTGTVDIQAEKLRVLSRREGQAEVSGTLALSRTDALLRLGGMLRVTDADLNIANLPKPGLPTLEVNFGEPETEDDVRSFASSTTEIDVRIVSEGRINVRGRGLNAAMNLDAVVRGAFDAPIVTGQMSIERGRFDFLSKRFEFQDSVVTLREDVLMSRLSLDAVRETPDLTAVVAIRGTLERPEITLSSEPNLPEDEVLSRILFGRSPTQLSAIETARLAAAISQLSGGSGFDLFGSLENAIGLDTLEVGQNDTGQTQLTTGKYLSDDVYLEVRTAAEGTTGLAVEWQVRDNISLEAETLPNERQRLSVQWKKDFD